MRIGKFVGAATLVPLALVGCGGSSKDTAKTAPTPTASASIAASPTVSPEVGQKLEAAIAELTQSTDLTYGIVNVAVEGEDTDGIISGARQERTAFAAYDSALREIDFPASAATARNKVFDDVNAIIRGLDKVNNATTAKEAETYYFDSYGDTDTYHANTRALRVAAGLPAETPTPKTRVIREDKTFSAEQGGWDITEGDKRITRGGDKYTIELLGGFSLQTAPDKGPELPQDISVEATMTTPTDPKSQFGLTCPGASGNRYEGLLTANGSVMIAYSDDSLVKHFLTSQGAGTVKLESGTNDIRLDCRKIDGGTDVVMYVNGKRVDNVAWTQPMVAGHYPGIAFNTYKPDALIVTDYKISKFED